MIEAKRLTINANGTALSAVDYGGNGPEVLLLHGLAGNAMEWCTIAGWMTEYFHVFALDQRGHGESAKGCGDYSRDAYVEDGAAVIKALCVDPVVLVGQSMGALNAYLVAARYPQLVSGLVLIEAGITNSAEVPEKVAAWLDSWPLAFRDLDEARAFFGGDSLSARTWAAGLVQTPDGYVPQFDKAEMVDSVRDHESVADYDADWVNIACPTLLVLGAEGWIPQSDVERMQSLKPDLSVRVVPAAGHDVHLDNPSGLRAVVEPFLRRFLE